MNFLQTSLLLLGIAFTDPIVTKFPPPAAPQAPTPPPLRVFLLAGQSNMEGHGVVDLDDPRDYNGGRGNLVKVLADPALAARFRHLRMPDGGFVERDDVFVSYRTEEALKCGALSVGFAVYSDRHHFGPELGIGHALGEHFQEPILLVKTAWGGKSLAKDFRPPSSGGTVGPCYRQMVAEYRAALVAIATNFPRLAAHPPRLDGIVWFQGWNDGCEPAAAAEYEENLVHLIGDLRAEFGDPKLPFVVGETGNIDNLILRAGQEAGCRRAAAAGPTRFVATHAFLRKPEDSPNTTHSHHWYGNGESYLLIGDALGRAMVELIDPAR